MSFGFDACLMATIEVKSSSEISGDSSASINILEDSHKARLKFSYVQDASEDSLIQS